MKRSSGTDVELYLSGLYHQLDGVTGIPFGLSWIPSDGDVFDEKLIAYYQYDAGAMLTSATDERFQSLLLSMSFTDSSASSVAVRQALYALTALHVNGPAAAVKYKRKAVRALTFSHSLQEFADTKERLQHIAAGLLLGLFEMNDPSSPTNQADWAAHVCNAKKAARFVYSLDQSYTGDVRILLEWMFYHDAVSRFSAGHWSHRSEGMIACSNDHQVRRALQLCDESEKIMATAGCSAEVLEAIAEVCDFVFNGRAPGKDDVERLERKLVHARQYIPTEGMFPDQETTKIAELYRLAGLVYLYRACLSLPSSSPKITSVIDAAFTIIRELQMYERSFPLLIVGCEARNDEERLLVLELIRRTQGRRRIANLDIAQRLMEKFWIQSDLDTGEEIGYVTKMDGIISQSRRLPSFV